MVMYPVFGAVDLLTEYQCGDQHADTGRSRQVADLFGSFQIPKRPAYHQENTDAQSHGYNLLDSLSRHNGTYCRNAHRA